MPSKLPTLKFSVRYGYWLLRIAGLGLLAWYITLLVLPAGDGHLAHELVVVKGARLPAIAQELYNFKLLRSPLHFQLVARLRGLDKKMQAGDYRMTNGMRPVEILNKMARGEVDGCRFAVPEGYSIYQVAELLEQQGIYSKKAFLDACHDRELLASLKLDAKSVEGYLMPGTYLIGSKLDERGLIAVMVRNFTVKVASVEQQLRSSGMSLHQIVILASMIEKEAVSAEEKPLISSVFHNRLRLGMPLQSDPTAIYGVRAFGGTVKKEDLRRPSPYNTYRIKGLPAGPIGSPGLDAIRAALEPASTDYLYFVARQNGTHQFSRTLREHINGVNTFLRKNRKRATSGA
jgi:UPF0755 protein